MPPTSPDAAPARRILAAPDARDRDPANVVAVAERMSADLSDALTRWFGPYGTHALLTRALAQARSAQPAFAGVRLRAPLAPVLDGLAELAQGHGAEAVADGIGAVLAAVVDLLGRLIGEDLALQLVERSMDGVVQPAPAPPAGGANPAAAAGSAEKLGTGDLGGGSP